MKKSQRLLKLNLTLKKKEEEKSLDKNYNQISYQRNKCIKKNKFNLLCPFLKIPGRSTFPVTTWFILVEFIWMTVAL